MPKRRDESWPAVRQRPSDFAWDVDCGTVGGKRLRYTRANSQEAMALAKQLRDQRDRLGTASLKLSPEQILDATAAYDLLAGTSLLEAARFYVMGAKPSIVPESVRFVDAVSARIMDMRQANRRPRSIESALSRLNAFGTEYGSVGVMVNVITTAAIINFLDIYKNPVTRKGMIVELRAFFQFCLKRGWIAKSPMDGITMPTIDQKMPKFWPFPKVILFMEWIRHEYEDTALIPALGFFAGLRPDEIRRLEWTDINKPGEITIRAEASKVRRSRHIKISSNLQKWIDYALTSGGTDDIEKMFNFFNLNARKNACHALGMVWSPDIMRHTFATMHYALHQNAAMTAAEMGNSNDVMFKHYRGLVSKEEAEKFWKIVPPEAKS